MFFTVLASTAMFVLLDDGFCMVAAILALFNLMDKIEARNWEFCARGWRDLYYSLKKRELRGDTYDGENWRNGGLN